MRLKRMETASRRDAILVENVFIKNNNPVGVEYSRHLRMNNIELLRSSESFVKMTFLPIFRSYGAGINCILFRARRDRMVSLVEWLLLLYK